MRDKPWTTKDIVGCDVLSLTELKTIEDGDDQAALTELLHADDFAVDLIVRGVLLPIDAGPIRLMEAIAAVSGFAARGHCRRCEADVNRNGSDRERAGYFVGMAVGLRLAQVTAMRDKAIAREELLHRAGAK